MCVCVVIGQCFVDCIECSLHCVMITNYSDFVMRHLWYSDDTN